MIRSEVGESTEQNVLAVFLSVLERMRDSQIIIWRKRDDSFFPKIFRLNFFPHNMDMFLQPVELYYPFTLLIISSAIIFRVD